MMRRQVLGDRCAWLYQRSWPGGGCPGGGPQAPGGGLGCTFCGGCCQGGSPGLDGCPAVGGCPIICPGAEA
eukprot:scaffold661385_cov34-Prasinocladus_malaysianus.AAC.1